MRRLLLVSLCSFTFQCAGEVIADANCTPRDMKGNICKQTSNSEAEEVALFTTSKIQPISFALMATLLMATIMERAHIKCIPESALVICVGAILGYILKAHGLISNISLLKANAPIVNHVFLPLIIFDSGWSLRSKDFASQFLYILVFAVIGTFIATVAVGLMIYATGDLHGIDDKRTAFTYASLIAATDPVATLATYSALKVEPLLSIFVFGESTINDAVAIVAFDIMNSPELFDTSETSGDLPTQQILKALGFGIGQKLIGSICLGLGLAFCFALALKFGDMKHACSFEILFVATSCYLTFATAEQLHFSGIIAVLFCGAFMGIYAKPHLSEEGNYLSSFFIKAMACLADMGIFLLVGMDTTLLNFTSLRLSGYVMVFCLIGRAMATFPCGLVVNCLKKKAARKHGYDALPLPPKYLFMMWHAGLRGGIALVLCLEMGDWVGKEKKQELINATVAVILVFLLVFGGSTATTLNYLGIPMGMDVDEGYLYDKSVSTFAQRMFESIDRKVCWPCLHPTPGGSSSSAMASHLELKDLVKRPLGMYWFTTMYYQGNDEELDSDEQESS